MQNHAIIKMKTKGGWRSPLPFPDVLWGKAVDSLCYIYNALRQEPVLMPFFSHGSFCMVCLRSVLAELGHLHFLGLRALQAVQLHASSWYLCFFLHYEDCLIAFKIKKVQDSIFLFALWWQLNYRNGGLLQSGGSCSLGRVSKAVAHVCKIWGWSTSCMVWSKRR